MPVRRIRNRRAILCATVVSVLVCALVAQPSIATCCPPHPGDGVVNVAAAHRCCAAACSFSKVATNADGERVSLLPPDPPSASLAAVVSEIEPAARFASTAAPATLHFHALSPPPRLLSCQFLI